MYIGFFANSEKTPGGEAGLATPQLMNTVLGNF